MYQILSFYYSVHAIINNNVLASAESEIYFCQLSNKTSGQLPKLQ